MFHTVKHVMALPDMKLSVRFAEGVTKICDIAEICKPWPAFKALETDHGLFESVEVDVGGYGIVWNDDLDLSCDELWEQGQTISTPFDNLMSFGDATELWNLSESTLRKAVAYGKLVDGVDVCKFGKQWIVAIDAMRREYGEPAPR